jgi:predicted RND superfamily exporter protein
MVFLLAVVLALPMGWYGFTHIEVDADTGNLVSDRLPWRQANHELERAFPHLMDEIQVVIDGASPEIAM